MAFNVKEHLINLKGKQYLPVASRLVWFREEHPDWAIVTEPVMIDTEKGTAVFKATVYNTEGKALGSGTKMETARGFADYIEKAETGSIGRALAVCGYGTQFAPELEEGDRIVDSPLPIGNPISQSVQNASASEKESSKLYCSSEECGREMTRGQYEYSSHAFGKPLCPTCQREQSKGKTVLSMNE